MTDDEREELLMRLRVKAGNSPTSIFRAACEEIARLAAENKRLRGQLSDRNLWIQAKVREYNIPMFEPPLRKP